VHNSKKTYCYISHQFSCKNPCWFCCLLSDDVGQLPRRPGSSRYRVLPSIKQNSAGQCDAAKQSLTAGTEQHRDTNEHSGDVADSTLQKQPIEAGLFKAQSVSVDASTAGDYTPSSSRSNDICNDNLNRTSDTVCSNLRQMSPAAASKHNISQEVARTDDRSDKQHSQQFRAKNQTISSPVTTSAAENTRQVQRMSLAIKLPSGQRFEGQFRPNDSLATVMQFAESAAKCSFADCEFVCAEPRCVLNDLQATLVSCGIANKSALYIQLPPPDGK